MTEPILLQFIDKVYKNSHDYCVICLRTSEERRLDKPIYLKRFIQNVSNLNEQCFLFNHSNQLVCFVCERQAAGAYRFLASLGLATHAHDAVQRLIDSQDLRYQFRTSYVQYILSNPKPDLDSIGAPESMLHLEARLRQLRMTSQLLQTEVLVVSTQSTNLTDTLDVDCEVTSGPGESRDVYVIPDLMPVTSEKERTSETLHLKADSEINVESIVILEDDDSDSTEAEPPPPSKMSKLQTKTPKIGVKTRGSDRIVSKIRTAAPVIESAIEKVTRNQGAESRLGVESRIVPIDNLPEGPSKLSPLLLTTPSFILHPLIFNSGMMTVPSLSASIMEGQLVTSVGNTLTFETPELALQADNNIEFIIEPEKVTNVLKNLSHQDAPKVFIFKPMLETATVNIAKNNCASVPNPDQNIKNTVTVNSSDINNPTCGNEEASICAVSEARSLEREQREDEGMHVRESDGARSGDNRVRESKTPQLRSDRIDWEDKIPMDVISFVDNDESTCKRSRRSQHPPPPLGISNVTSLSQEEDVIDLC